MPNIKSNKITLFGLQIFLWASWNLLVKRFSLERRKILFPLVFKGKQSYSQEGILK